MAEFPYLYPGSFGESRRQGEEQQYDASFRQNIGCALAIEQAIRDHSLETGDGLAEGCAQSVLEQYGFKRVNYVLTNSVQEADCWDLISDEARTWVRNTFVPIDSQHNRYFAVESAVPLLEAFIGQTRECYQALGLFGPEHCVEDRTGLDYTGKVLVLDSDALRENCWDTRNQLWEAYTGFGCSPTSSGRAVYATCLGDGEKARFYRSDFLGVLDDQFLPDWAREKLEELHAPKHDGPSMGGMG